MSHPGEDWRSFIQGDGASPHKNPSLDLNPPSFYKEELKEKIKAKICELEANASKYEAVYASYLNVLSAKTSEDDFSKLRTSIELKVSEYKPKDG